MDKECIVTRAGITPSNSNFKISHLRTHMYAYILAHNANLNGKNGKFYIRCDDSNNVKHNFGIFEDILKIFVEELGMNFGKNLLVNSNIIRQSQRKDIYNNPCEKLINNGLAYNIPNSRAVCFNVKNFIEIFGDTIEFHDGVFGKKTVNLKQFARTEINDVLKKDPRDFFIRRSDGTYLYHFCSVIDDNELGITHIIRGSNKLSIVPYQEMIRKSLELNEFNYIHIPLMLLPDKDLHHSSNNVQTLDYRELIKCGITNQAILSYLCSFGYGDPDTIYESIDEFARSFDIKKIHKSSSLFDYNKLQKINRTICSKLEDKKYHLAINKFFKESGSNNAEIELLNDPEFDKILTNYKREPKEIAELVKKILDNKYEEIESKFINSTEKILCIIEYLLNKKELNLQHIKDLTKLIPRKEYYHSLSWILSGSYSGANPEDIFEYLHGKKLINKKIENARTILENTKNRINKIQSIDSTASEFIKLGYSCHKKFIVKGILESDPYKQI